MSLDYISPKNNHLFHPFLAANFFHTPFANKRGVPKITGSIFHSLQFGLVTLRRKTPRSRELVKQLRRFRFTHLELSHSFHICPGTIVTIGGLGAASCLRSFATTSSAGPQNLLVTFQLMKSNAARRAKENCIKVMVSMIER